jgi:uncharacterized protein YjbI with pentapeptide repeats
MRMTALVVVASIVFFVAAGTLSAYNETDLQKLKTTKNCADCDLSGALLMHWVLSGADLSGADLTGANLTGANLTGANLTGAWLPGANLAGANLSSAIMTSASLANANLFRAKLSGSNLLFTNLAGATWTDGSRCERHSSGWCKK